MFGVIGTGGGQRLREGFEPAFKDFVVETRITSNAPVEMVREVARLTHLKCPMHASIVKIGPVIDRLFINDVETSL